MRYAAVPFLFLLGACAIPEDGRHRVRDGEQYRETRLSSLIGRDLKDGALFVCDCKVLGVSNGDGIAAPAHLLITDAEAGRNRPWLERGLRAHRHQLDAVSGALTKAGCSVASPCRARVWFVYRSRPLSQDRYDLVAVDRLGPRGPPEVRKTKPLS